MKNDHCVKTCINCKNESEVNFWIIQDYDGILPIMKLVFEDENNLIPVEQTTHSFYSAYLGTSGRRLSLTQNLKSCYKEATN